MRHVKIIPAIFALLALSACGSSEPPPAPFTFVYDTPEHVVNVDMQTADTSSPAALSQLSPAAGGTAAKFTNHDNDPGTSQIRDSDIRHAIRENKYERLGMVRTLPSDY